VPPPRRMDAVPRHKNGAERSALLVVVLLAAGCATTAPAFRPAVGGEVERAEEAWAALRLEPRPPAATRRMLYDATYRDGDVERSATAAVTLEDEQGMTIALSGPFGVGLGRAQWRGGSVTVTDRNGKHARIVPEDSPEFGEIFGVPLSVREFAGILSGRPGIWPPRSGAYQVAGADLARVRFETAGGAEEFTFHLQPPALVAWRVLASSSALAVTYGPFDHGLPLRLTIEELPEGRTVKLVRTAYESGAAAPDR
jgi:hypothetical protein